MGETGENAPQADRGETGGALACLPKPERGPPEEPLRLARVRPHAGFVAQLIATAEHLPQARALRRADPAQAQQSYQSAADQDRPKPHRGASTSRVV